MSLRNIKEQAARIRGEKQPGQNSAERIGKCFEDIANQFDNYTNGDDVNRLVDSTNKKLESREKELEKLKDSISLGYFPDNRTYEAPAEMYHGNERFTAVGYAQHHYFETQGYVNTIIGCLEYSPSNNARVIVRTQDDLNDKNPFTASGTVLMDRNLTESDYDSESGEVRMVFEGNIPVEAGKYLLCYYINNDNMGVLRFREWFLWTARPQGYRSFIFKGGPSDPWIEAGGDNSLSYSQVPLKIYSSHIAYDKYKTLEDKIDLIRDNGSRAQLFLPSTIYAVAGREANVYFDAITLLPETGSNPPDAMIEVSCPLGRVNVRGWQFTPADTDAGEYPFEVRIYNNDGTVGESAEAILKVSPAVNSIGERYILLTGDSTLDDNPRAALTLYENLGLMEGTVPAFAGSKQMSENKNVRHEALTGKTIDIYANGCEAYKFTFNGADGAMAEWPNWLMTQTDGSGYIVSMRVKLYGDGSGYVIANGWYEGTETIGAGWTGELRVNDSCVINIVDTEMVTYSPFLFDGQLDFEAYAGSVDMPSGTKIDLYCIDLSMNDCRGGLKTDAMLAETVNNLKRLVEAFRAYNPDGKVMVCLPKSAASSVCSNEHSSYRINVHRLRKLIIAELDANLQYPYVAICNSGISIDRYYGYPVQQVKAADRISREIYVHSDEIHPSDEGYDQIADAYTACITDTLR